MDEIQKSIIDAIKIQVNEKIKDLQFDKTCYGKVVAIRDDTCDVEIRGEITQCKIRNGLQICENDIVLVRLINNDFSNKFVDAKLGTVGDDVAIELIGNLSSLLTTAKTNIVAAINEVFNKAEDVEDNLATHKAEIATSTQLGHVKVGQNLAIDSDGTLHAQASSGKKVARFVIGTSTAGWTAKDCDYLCDGTNDQEEIIQALNALPATGGEVVILDGTYNITASINIPKDNVSLRGNGNATILKRMYNSTSTSSGATARGLITLNEKSGCKIQGLQIDGNRATYAARNNYGIYLYSSSDNTVTGNTCNNNDSGIYLSSSSDNTVTGNTCNNNDYGIYLYSSSDNTVTGNTCNNSYSGIDIHSSSDNTITGNTCNNSNYGIRLYSSSNNNTATGNTCNNNDNGIYLYSSSNNNTITGNTCSNNNNSGIYLYSSSDNTVTGNTCNNNDYSGIYLSSSSDNTVTGNTCNTNSHGIYLYSSNNNTITGNTCNNNDNGIYLSSSSNNNTSTGNTCNNNDYGIYLYSSSINTITGNICNNNDNGIRLYSSSDNTVTGNTCNTNSHGIYLYSSNNNTITGNTCSNNNNGIYLYSSSNNNTITGNTCIRGTGQTSDYTSNQYTIRLRGTGNNYNLISSNNCMGKAVVIEGGTGNSAWGNKFDNTDDLP